MRMRLGRDAARLSRRGVAVVADRTTAATRRVGLGLVAPQCRLAVPQQRLVAPPRVAPQGVGPQKVVSSGNEISVGGVTGLWRGVGRERAGCRGTGPSPDGDECDAEWS